MSQKIYMYDTQWQALLNAIGQGDTSALVTALNDIADAIQNQTLTLDFSNLNSDAVSNLSNVTGDNVSDALDNLKSDLTPVKLTLNDFFESMDSAVNTHAIYKIGKTIIIERMGAANPLLDNNHNYIGTIKPIYRPKSGQAVRCIMDINGNGTLGRGFMDTDGKFYLYTGESRITALYLFPFAYVIN